MTRHLAELNIGRLLAPTDDPRVADFMNALDLINGMGKQMPGFVWMMEGSGEPGTGNTETKIGGDPQFVSNLTVWESVDPTNYAAERLAQPQRRSCANRKNIGQQLLILWPTTQPLRGCQEK